MRVASLLVFLSACSTSSAPLADPVVDDIGEAFVGVAHPKGTFVNADLVGYATGGLDPGKKDRYVDLSIAYDREGTRETMWVRVYVTSLDPCKVRVDVKEDTGPAPVVLDNSVVGRIVGHKLCAAFTPG